MDPAVETSLPPPAGKAVPQRPEELSADWLTACLRHAGALGEGRVVSIRHARIGAGKGFAGHLARIELTYDNPADNSPPSMIAKFASEHGAMRDMMGEMGGYQREVRFYRELAADVGVSTPRCFLAHFDRAGGRFLLLLEDMAPSASPGIARGLSFEQARVVMEQIAQLHARWWNRSDELSWLEIDDDTVRTVRDRYMESLPSFLRDMGPRYPVLARVARAIGHMFEGDEWVDKMRAGPRTLVHNDLHVENIFLPTQAGGRFALIDWQGVALGRHGIGDVTRILCMGLPAELRRAHTRELLAHYHERLCALGVTGYSFERLQARYREEMISMVIIAVMAFATIDFEGEAETAEIIGDRIETAVREARVARAVTVFVWLMRVSRWLRRLFGRPAVKRL